MRTIARICICTLSAVLFICLFLTSVSAIHVPVDTKAVAIPLGEQNRVEDRWPVKDHDPYVEVNNVDLSTLPKSAWCRDTQERSHRGIGLSCAWPTEDSVVKFQTAFMFVPLPSTDVMHWRFDRKSLMAVPTTETWLRANFWYMVGAALCLCLALVSLCFALNPEALREPEYSDGPLTDM